VSEPLAIALTVSAAAQIRSAEDWWRVNRPKAPNAIREDLERASSLISIQPKVGAHARSVALSGIRRLHLARIRYDLYYRVLDPQGPIEISRSGTRVGEAGRQSSGSPGNVRRSMVPHRK